ncbi:hypothetical protein RRG08_047428 [Elysia crispata]|uniref:Uncharacterized protein n=1 Tax=Elysia crispata TaxID=231223 RepID=A0AAE0YUG1_9GAST|nr:hypothetical protein RRG08_047428 [Elysia crispata]
MVCSCGTSPANQPPTRVCHCGHLAISDRQLGLEAAGPAFSSWIHTVPRADNPFIANVVSTITTSMIISLRLQQQPPLSHLLPSPLTASESLMYLLFATVGRNSCPVTVAWLRMMETGGPTKSLVYEIDYSLPVQNINFELAAYVLAVGIVGEGLESTALDAAVVGRLARHGKQAH